MDKSLTNAMALLSLHGRMLRGRWQRQKVEAQFLFGTAADLAVALQYTHELRVSHGDVYAHNVLVDWEQATARAVNLPGVPYATL